MAHKLRVFLHAEMTKAIHLLKGKSNFIGSSFFRFQWKGVERFFLLRKTNSIIAMFLLCHQKFVN